MSTIRSFTKYTPTGSLLSKIVMDRSQNYALHFIFIFALHLKILPRQHEMHATSRFKCHALHLHFMQM